MQVSDLFYRLKLILFGFLSPLFIGLGFLFLSPYFLSVSDPFQKSEYAVLEASELPSKKGVLAIASLFQKQTIKKLLVVIKEEKTQNHLISAKSKAQILSSELSEAKIDPSLVEFFFIPPGKNGEIEEAAKLILKQLVTNNAQSLLVICKQYDAKMNRDIFQKNLNSLQVKISIYSFPSEYTASNWFLSEDGFREVVHPFVRYLYFKIRGIL
ncbi:hypothetical protein LPTSP4_04540 [Leptospira ryugenii]|uniref:DUF218 domain-containing protein n=1 Tax=Leptospira ryugenii TaxID=1917863 RepID=A0A2P2DWK5_9LEPT|nr:hypothetical protein [Leptospira ryugenii]GBF48950.1 hypothetical protein LPTSP4_04540 [Leptospira ryugenii]